jgi:hypothetical protein
VAHLKAESTPSGIKLTWPDADVARWSVWRRIANPEPDWELLEVGIREPGEQSYTDTTAQVGSAYEYRLITEKNSFNGPGTGIGTTYDYVYAGREAPLVEDRGRVLLVVDETMASSLSAKLDQLKRNLIGDGWRVQRIDVPRVDVPRTNNNPDPAAYKNAINSVKAQIVTIYNQNPVTLKAILLIGHVPVPYSGFRNADGHLQQGGSDHDGAWVADAYYGDMAGAAWEDVGTDDEGQQNRTYINLDFPENSNRIGDGKLDHDRIRSDIEVPVGRIDFAHMPDFADQQGASELQLLERYLEKNDKWRAAQRNVLQREHGQVHHHWPRW